EALDTVSIPIQESTTQHSRPRLATTAVRSSPYRAGSTPSTRGPVLDSPSESNALARTAELNMPSADCSGKFDSTFDWYRGSSTPQARSRSATQSLCTRTSGSGSGTGSPVKLGVDEAGMWIRFHMSE